MHRDGQTQNSLNPQRKQTLRVLRSLRSTSVMAPDGHDDYWRVRAQDGAPKAAPYVRSVEHEIRRTGAGFLESRTLLIF